MMKELSAGGIVYRHIAKTIEVLAVEDRFGKFTFAKGRQEPGETRAQTAVREIAEETGVQGKIRKELGSVCYNYTDPRRGTIEKQVTYFLVEAVSGTISPQRGEIVRLQWLPLAAVWDIYVKRGYNNNLPILARAISSLQEFANGKNHGN